MPECDRTIAAIVPTFRRWHSLLETVESFIGCSPPPDEIVIVDQTPEEEITEVQRQRLSELRSSFSGDLKYVRQEEPHVYRARNLGAKAARSDILVYADDDMLPTRDCIAAYSAAFADEEMCAAVGPVRSPHSPLPWQQDVPDLSAVPAAEKVFDRPRYNWLKRVRWIAFIHANFAVRRSTLYEVGGWDEIGVYDDKELGFRLHELGKRIDYVPEALAFHCDGKAGGLDLKDASSPWSAHDRAVTTLYIGFRYLHMRPLFGRWGFWRAAAWRAARHTFLLKRSLMRPWVLLKELGGYASAFVHAIRHARSARRSQPRYI